MNWSQGAIEKLEKGDRAQVRPRGHSMSGRIGDGDCVTLEPVAPQQVRVGDVVLARVQGKRRELLVLHEVLERRGEAFLIGARFGRVNSAAILGLAVQIES